MAIFLSARLLLFAFLFMEPSCGLAALWFDASLEASQLHTSAQPQMELYVFETIYMNKYFKNSLHPG
jgi:hypothetical protein